MKKLLNYSSAVRRLMLFGIAMALLSTALTMIGPQILRRLSDVIQQGIGNTVDIDAVIYLCAILAIIYSIALAVHSLQNYSLSLSSIKICNLLRRDLSHKLNRLPVSFFDRSSTGDVLSRITNDTDTIGGSFAQSIPLSIHSVCLIAGSMIMMMYTNLYLALVVGVPMVLALLIMSVAIRRSQKYFRRQQHDTGQVNTVMEQTYYGMDIVRAFGGRESSLKRFLHANSNLRKDAFLSSFISGILPKMMNFFNNLGYVLVCIVGCILVSEGKITFGVVIAFIVYIRMFTHPIVQLQDSMSMLQSVQASGARIFEILEAPEPEEDAEPDPEWRSDGSIEFKGVSFSYVPGRTALEDMTFRIEPGRKIAIVGPTGAGKTTVTNLLMRFYDADSGTVLVGGRPVGSVRVEDLRRQFTMIPQEPWVFKGTLRDNVAFTTDATDEEVWNALRTAGLENFARSIGGLDAVISDGLSSGQRQQVSIARSLIRNAPIAIMDEATSSVDTRTEKSIQEALSGLMRGRTSVIIAHRLTTILDADEILVMENGRITEHGDHKSLLELNRTYARLYNSQFMDFDD